MHHGLCSAWRPVRVRVSGVPNVRWICALAWSQVAVGASALLLSFLGLVPSAVAQGLFIFMGVSGLANNQLVDR